MRLDQERREGRAPPFVAARRQRAQRIAVIALAAGDDVAALLLAALGEILPRHLERRFDRFRPTAHQIGVADALGGVGDQAVGEFLGHVGGEEAGMGIGELVELLVQGRRHRWMAVPQAGHRGATRRVDVALAGGIDDFDAPAAGGDRQVSADLAMQDMGHAFSRCPRRGRCTPNAESCASVCSSAASALLPPRPATRAARISATASKRRHGVKERGAFGRHQDGRDRDLRERRDLGIGQRHDRHALCRRIARAVDGGAGVRLDAGGQQDVGRTGVANGVQAGAARIVQHHRLVAQKRQHVVEVPGGGVAGTQPQTVDAPCLVQAAGRIGQAFERCGFGKGCDLARQPLRHLGRQRPLAAQLLRLDLDARLAGEAQGAGAHRAGIELAHLIVAFETQPLGEPRHGGGAARRRGAPARASTGAPRRRDGRACSARPSAVAAAGCRTPRRSRR